MGVNKDIYILRKSIEEVINKSGVPASAVYYVVADLLRSLDRAAVIELNKELEEEQKSEKKDK